MRKVLPPDRQTHMPALYLAWIFTEIFQKEFMVMRLGYHVDPHLLFCPSVRWPKDHVTVIRHQGEIYTYTCQSWDRWTSEYRRPKATEISLDFPPFSWTWLNFVSQLKSAWGGSSLGGCAPTSLPQFPAILGARLLYFVLYCIVLYCNVFWARDYCILYCIVLDCMVMYFGRATIVFCIHLYCIVFWARD